MRRLVPPPMPDFKSDQLMRCQPLHQHGEPAPLMRGQAHQSIGGPRPQPPIAHNAAYPEGRNLLHA